MVYANSLGNFSLVIILFLSSLAQNGCSQRAMTDTIVLGTNASYPPYESIGSDGQPQGFDIDLAKGIAKSLQKKLVIKDMGFDALVLALKQGKIDFIMAGLSITQSRLKKIAMIPYQGDSVKSYVLVFKKAIPEGFANFNDLKNLNGPLSVQSGSLMEEFLQNSYPKVDVKALEGTSEVIIDVIHNKSSAGLIETHVAKAVLPKQTQLASIEIRLSEKDWVLGNGIGVKKENTELIKQITDAVSSLKKSGEILKLESLWLQRPKP